MSKRNRREHGRIISVETKARGDALAEDVAAGVTAITVEDAGDFDEDGGWLLIGGQVVEFTECDDDTGVITLVDPLDAAAEQGDPVQVWSDLYDEVVDYQLALVELDGEYDNPDPVVAEVAEGVEDLPEGDRGKAGESCTLKRVGDDEWEVVGVGGRPRASSGASAIRFEQDDTYTLTSGDIAAGSAVMSLTKRPIDEALTCVLAGVPQRPTEWTINYDAQTLTLPLDGWEKVGDVLWVHYAYRQSIATPSIVPDALTSLVLIGTSYYKYPDTDPTNFPLPAETQAGDLIVVAAATNGAVSMSDARMTERLASGDDVSNGKLWTGIADGSGVPLNFTMTDNPSFPYSAAALAVFRGPIAALNVVAESGTAGMSIEAMSTTMAVAAAYSGYYTVDGALGIPAGWTAARDTDNTGKVACNIVFWNGVSPSPASTWVASGTHVEARFGSMVVGVS